MYCDGDKSVEFVVAVVVAVVRAVVGPGSSTLPQHPAAEFDDGSDGAGCVGFAVAHLMARDYTGIVAGTYVTVEELGLFIVGFLFI